MDYTLYPLCYHDTLSDSEIAKQECSDGIYVSVEEFRNLMGDDNDEMIVYRIGSGDREAFAHVCGTHSGERYTVIAPMWVCGVLDYTDGMPVTVERARPTLGIKIKIKPHSTEYADAEDPVGVLQHAFEAYSSIMPGVEIPLMVEGRPLHVSILETNGGGPICIRGVELEVEIEGDPPEPEPEQEANTPAPPEPANDPRFPGRGYRLGS